MWHTARSLRSMNNKQAIKDEITSLFKSGSTILGELRKEDSKKSLHFDYQRWYSKALRAVQALAPDRYEEFRRFYEPDPKRKSLGYGTYVIQDYLKGVAPGAYQLKDFDCRAQAAHCLYNQLAILTSIVARIDSVLADIEATLYTQLQDAELSTAKTLMSASPRAAGALAGTVLEGYLQKVAASRGVKITKKFPTISDLNDPLKQSGVYDITAWRKISYLADIRNTCSHKKAADPTADQVTELINGTNWVIKNVS